MEQPDFDRAVEMLLIKHHGKVSPTWTVTAFDGRGGDGGRDVEVRNEQGGLEILYQLKCFPEGFSGGWGKSRKPQIEKSHKRGMELEPKAWKLVIPGNPTTGEHKFVEDLRGSDDPPTSIVGRAQLDSWISDFPLVLAALTREPVVDALRAVNAEHLDLSTSDNVTAAALDFASRMSGVSVYWERRVTIASEGVVHEIRPLRPDAAEREPLNVTIEINRDMDAERLSAWREFVGFGGPTAALEPEDVVKIERIGPSWFAGETTGVGIKAGGPVTVPRAIELRAIEVDGRTSGAITGLFTTYPPGAHGVRIDANFPGGFDVQLLVPDDRNRASVPGTVRVTLQPIGKDARAVHGSMAFYSAARGSHRVEMWVDGKRLSVMGWPKRDDDEFDPFTEQLASDLDLIGRYGNVRIEIPDSISDRDRREIRRCRLLLDGKCITEPAFTGVTVTLSGSTSPELEHLLSGTAGALQVGSALLYDILGHQIKVDDLAMVLTQAVAENSEEALAALHAGEGRGVQVRLKSLNQKYPLVYSPGRYTGEPDTPLTPAPLGIIGFEEANLDV